MHENLRWHPCRSEPSGWHRFVASGDPAAAAVGTYCVSLAIRAIADPGAATAGADDGGADFREFSLSPEPFCGPDDAALELAGMIEFDPAA